MIGQAKTAEAPDTPEAPDTAEGGRDARRVYLGTYTDAGGLGIVSARADGSGALTVEDALGAVPRPSWLAAAPGGRLLYAASEVEDGQVAALAIGDDGSLRELGRQSAHGDSPAHLSLHPGGRFLLSASFFGGNLAVHPIGPDGAPLPASDVVRHTGSGPHPDQASPHPHQILTDPWGRYVLVADLGTDTVHTYRLDLGSGRLRPRSRARLRPGAGPRHLAFHPDGRTFYVAAELDSTVTVCSYDPHSGRVRPGQVVPTVPAGTTGANHPGEILVSPDGRHVFCTNRGHDSVAVFTTSAGGRALSLTGTVPCGGTWPRHMEFADGGRLLYVANQMSGTVAAFRVEGARLTPAGAPLVTPSPVCVRPRF
ncbi:lactonase family protein [Spirillospora sp. NPDC047279]|uniref:lactonase family protein n=1 Tax=Spirillospora sp. NPDC047279 TaxID=3155478 RepID=UPI0033FF8D2A